MESDIKIVIAIPVENPRPDFYAPFKSFYLPEVEKCHYCSGDSFYVQARNFQLNEFYAKVGCLLWGCDNWGQSHKCTSKEDSLKEALEQWKYFVKCMKDGVNPTETPYNTSNSWRFYNG